jgi:hypothetical protein
MACPRARLQKVLLEMSLPNPDFQKMMDLFDELRPVEKAVHDAELHTARLDHDVERRLFERRGPAIQGHEIAVVRSIEEQK